jgi:hypothetical protein
MCSVVESMFSFNEMFSILGGVPDADRAERIAMNGLPATWASQQGGTMWSHPYFTAVNQVRAVNVTREGQGDGNKHHLYQDGDPVLESYFGGGENGGCCTANNGQGWPKYALRSVFRTPADGGVAIGVLAPVRVQLAPQTALLVNTDYPFEDRAEVLIQGPLAAATPVRVRVPAWATAARAWLNGAKLPAPANGTMFKAVCPASPSQPQLCNLTLDTNPTVRLEGWYNDSVSVLRGSLLFSMYIGNNFTDYKACEDYPYPSGAGAACPHRGPKPRPAEAKWLGVERTAPYNMALVINDLTNPQRSFELQQNGLGCQVSPTSAAWPACALQTPSTCVRQCDPPFTHTSFPLTLTATGRQVVGWGMEPKSDVEATPPPASPACAAAGVCGPPSKVLLVPHGSTALRIGSFPVA